MPDVNTVVQKQVEAAFSRSFGAVSHLDVLRQNLLFIRNSNHTDVEKLKAAYLRIHSASLELEQAKALLAGAQAFAIVAAKGVLR